MCESSSYHAIPIKDLWLIGQFDFFLKVYQLWLIIHDMRAKNVKYGVAGDNLIWIDLQEIQTNIVKKINY